MSAPTRRLIVGAALALPAVATSSVLPVDPWAAVRHLLRDARYYDQVQVADCIRAAAQAGLSPDQFVGAYRQFGRGDGPDRLGLSFADWDGSTWVNPVTVAL